jgi:hypothetical protein
MARATRILVTLALVCGALAVSSSRSARALTPESTLSYTSEPGDYIGLGGSGSFSPSNSTLTMDGDATAVILSAEVPFDRFTAVIAAPQGQHLTPRTYTGATRWGNNVGAEPGVTAYGFGRGCNTAVGSFELHQLYLDSAGTPIYVDADLVQHCEGPNVPALHVHMFSDALAAANPPTTSDDAFTVESDTTASITAADLLLNDRDPDPADSVTSVRIAGGPAHGFLTPTPDGFDYTPDAAFDGYDSFTYEAEDTTGRWSSAGTVALTVGTPPQDLFTYEGATGESVSQGRTATFVHADSEFEMQGSHDALRLDVRGNQETWTVALQAPAGEQLTPGTYPDAVRGAAEGKAGLDVSGDGRGCSSAFGNFTINAIAFADDGTPSMLDADLEQHCEVASWPALRASIRYHIPAVRPVTNTDEYTAPGAIAEPSPGVLTNDSDADPRNELTSLLMSRPQHGSVSLDVNGAFAYQADAGYVGDDHFVYRAADPFGLKSVPTIVTVHSTAPPVPDTAYLTLHDSNGGTQRIGGSIARGDLVVQNVHGWSTVNGSARVDDHLGGRAIIRFVMQPTATAGVVTGTVTVVDSRLGGTRTYRVTEATTRAPNQVSGNAKRIGRRVAYLRFSVTDQRSG